MLPAVVDADVAQPMRTRHGWFVQVLADAAFHWPTSLVRSAHATSYACKPWLMSSAVGRLRCLPGDAWRPWHTSLFPMRTCQVRCVQALNDTACCWADVTWLIGAGHDRCRPADALTPRLMCADLGRCRLSLVYACRPQMVSPNPCAHATADACRPWLMLHAISRRCLLDTHMPRPMRGFWLRGVGIVFPENHNKYVQPKYACPKVQTHITFHK